MARFEELEEPVFPSELLPAMGDGLRFRWLAWEELAAVDHSVPGWRCPGRFKIPAWRLPLDGFPGTVIPDTRHFMCTTTPPAFCVG